MKDTTGRLHESRPYEAIDTQAKSCARPISAADELELAGFCAAQCERPPTPLHGRSDRSFVDMQLNSNAIHLK